MRLASLWIEARGKGNWETFAIQRAFPLLIVSPEVIATLLRLDPPTVESGTVKYITRLREMVRSSRTKI